jgi:phosphatidylserine decarboxylase
LHGRRNPFVAQEGLPFLLLALAATVVLVRYHEIWTALFPAVIFVALYLLFRDPLRAVPPVALGVVSPVDGRVVEVRRLDEGRLGVAVHCVLIRVNSFGTYTARSPIEGKIMDLGKKALWVQTDEGDDVVLTFRGYRLGLAPRSFARFGERLGQGQRCAYLRLTRFAEVQLPITGKVQVAEGQRVVAGNDLLGSVPNPR